MTSAPERLLRGADGRKKPSCQNFKNNFLDIVLMVKTLAFSGLVMICLLADI